VCNVAIKSDPRQHGSFRRRDPIEASACWRSTYGKATSRTPLLENPWIDAGAEVPFGTGQVNRAACLDAVDKAAYMAISPSNVKPLPRVTRQDVRTAIKTLKSAA